MGGPRLVEALRRPSLLWRKQEGVRKRGGGEREREMVTQIENVDNRRHGKQVERGEESGREQEEGFVKRG